MQIDAIVLNDIIWEAVKNIRFQDWGDFQFEEEARFELTQNHLLDAFYAMRPTQGEICTQFIIPMEDKRVCYKVDPLNYYCTFIQFLDESERCRIDILHECSIAAVISTTRQSRRTSQLHVLGLKSVRLNWLPLDKTTKSQVFAQLKLQSHSLAWWQI